MNEERATHDFLSKVGRLRYTGKFLKQVESAKKGAPAVTVRFEIQNSLFLAQAPGEHADYPCTDQIQLDMQYRCFVY